MRILECTFNNKKSAKETITVFVQSNNTSKVEIMFTLNTDSIYTLFKISGN